MTRMSRFGRTLFWAIFCLILAYGAFNLTASFAWLHRTFPGFALHHEGTVDPLLPDRWSAARSGIQVGDRIVGVDGAPVTSAGEVYRQVAGLEPGTPVVYDLERMTPEGPVRLRRTVLAQRFGWRDWAGIPALLCLVGLVHLFIGALVSALKPADAVARAHLLYCWLMAVYFLGVFDTLSDFGPGIASLVAQGLLGASGLHLASLLPRRLPLAERHPWLRTVNGLLGLGVAIGTLVGYHTGHLFLSIQVVIGCAAVSGAALVLSALWARLSRTSSELERSQAGIILVGSALAFAPIVLLMVLGVVLGSIPMQMPELGFAGLLLFPAAIGYAIVRHRLFELDELVARALTYTLLSGVLVAAYFLLTGTLRSLWGSQSELVDVLVTAGIALAFAPLRDGIKARVDTVFFRTEYDLTRTVTEFADTAHGTLDRPELVAAFAERLEAALHPSYLLLATRTESGAFEAAYSAGLEARPEAGLSATDPHLTRLVREGRSIATAEGGSEWSDALWLPLTIKGELHGCLLVGPRKSGLQYGPDDRLLLVNLAQQLSLWLQNARLVVQVVLQAKELEQVEALKEADRLKDEFLSIISHELRTPISIIKGFGSVLQDELHGPVTDQHRYYLEKMLSAAGMLSYLVNDLLDMSRIRAGKLRLQPDALRFYDVVAEVSGSLAPLAVERTQAIVLEIPDDLPRVYGDRQRIAQVIANLLSNAVKFSPDGGTIWVRASAADGELVCSVRDEGRGIEPEDLPKLFQRFTQLDMTATRQVGGTGLGLSISKALIEAQRGRIGVMSTPGHGSTFWFSLPLVDDQD